MRFPDLLLDMSGKLAVLLWAGMGFAGPFELGGIAGYGAYERHGRCARRDRDGGNR
jgi:hypothetical protein